MIINEIMFNLSRIAPDDSFFSDWRNELFNPRTVDYTDRTKVLEWYHGLVHLYGPHLIGNKQCVLSSKLYVADMGRMLPQYGSFRCGYCNRWVMHDTTFNRSEQKQDVYYLVLIRIPYNSNQSNDWQPVGFQINLCCNFKRKGTTIRLFQPFICFWFAIQVLIRK